MLHQASVQSVSDPCPVILYQHMKCNDWLLINATSQAIPHLSEELWPVLEMF